MPYYAALRFLNLYGPHMWYSTQKYTKLKCVSDPHLDDVLQVERGGPQGLVQVVVDGLLLQHGVIVGAPEALRRVAQARVQPVQEDPELGLEDLWEMGN